jgi:hypothetical protein
MPVKKSQFTGRWDADISRMTAKFLDTVKQLRACFHETMKSATHLLVLFLLGEFCACAAHGLQAFADTNIRVRWRTRLFAEVAGIITAFMKYLPMVFPMTPFAPSTAQ